MSLIVAHDMAKKRPSPAPEPTPEAEGTARQPMIVQMRGSAAFKDYVERGAKLNRYSVAKMTELAIIHFLKSTGFTEEPPER